jgi:hypothetical protein
MKTRFRASIYLDIFIEGDKTLEQARAEAQNQVEGIVAVLSSPEDVGYHADLKDMNYSNPYVGGVAHYTPCNLLKPLDREI